MKLYDGSVIILNSYEFFQFWFRLKNHCSRRCNSRRLFPVAAVRSKGGFQVTRLYIGAKLINFMTTIGDTFLIYIAMWREKSRPSLRIFAGGLIRVFFNFLYSLLPHNDTPFKGSASTEFTMRHKEQNIGFRFSVYTIVYSKK